MFTKNVNTEGTIQEGVLKRLSMFEGINICIMPKFTKINISYDTVD